MINILAGHKLVDPKFDKPGPVDILIGAGLFWNLLCVGQIKRAKGFPTWQKTQLGWIVGGEIKRTRADSIKPTTLVVTNRILGDHLERLWTQEKVHERRQLSSQQTYCENYFNDTVSRDITGRFVVRLPKQEGAMLGESRQQATERFYALE